MDTSKSRVETVVSSKLFVGIFYAVVIQTIMYAIIWFVVQHSSLR